MAVKFGAIRWDAWYDPARPPFSNAGCCFDLSVNQARAPFFATQVGPNKLYVNGATQASMDQEITFAANAGLGFWAYDYFPASGTYPTNTFANAWALHQSSSLRNNMPWCWIYPIGADLDTNFTNGVVLAQMQLSNYATVTVSGVVRPLIFIECSSTIPPSSSYAAAIASLRTACTGAGLGSPYVVPLTLGFLPSQNATNVTNLGADANTSYACSTGATNAAYTALDTFTQNWWLLQAATGQKIVPICMAGWNALPRQMQPETFSHVKPWVAINNQYQLGTGAQITANVAAAKTYISATNPTQCEAQIGLIYSWNELSEGGRGLCPTWTSSGPAADILTALTGTL